MALDHAIFSRVTRVLATVARFRMLGVRNGRRLLGHDQLIFSVSGVRYGILKGSTPNGTYGRGISKVNGRNLAGFSRKMGDNFLSFL